MCMYARRTAADVLKFEWKGTTLRVTEDNKIAPAKGLSFVYACIHFCA